MEYRSPPPEPLINLEELTKRSLYKDVIAEFVATFLFFFIGVRTITGLKNQTDPALTSDPWDGVSLGRIIWGFCSMIFILNYQNTGVSGKHINPAVTLGLFLSRKVSLIRAVMYLVVQYLGSSCGLRLAKEFQNCIDKYGSGEITKGVAWGAEIIATSVLFYTFFSDIIDIDRKRSVDSHEHVLAPPTRSMASAMRDMKLLKSLAS